MMATEIKVPSTPNSVSVTKLAKNCWEIHGEAEAWVTVFDSISAHQLFLDAEPCIENDGRQEDVEEDVCAELKDQRGGVLCHEVDVGKHRCACNHAHKQGNAAFCRILKPERIDDGLLLINPSSTVALVSVGQVADQDRHAKLYEEKRGAVETGGLSVVNR